MKLPSFWVTSVPMALLVNEAMGRCICTMIVVILVVMKLEQEIDMVFHHCVVLCLELNEVHIVDTTSSCKSLKKLLNAVVQFFHCV